MFLEKLKDIKAFIFDVDGVLTNGLVHVTENGEQLRTFNIKDGYALQLAIKQGYQVVVITGGKSNGIALRLKGLGITQAFLGVGNKVEIYQQFLATQNINPEQIVYMGDDFPDYEVMKLVGLPVCPADAIPEIKAISQYISPKNGGEGCVRDIIEKVLKIQNKWQHENLSAEEERF